MPKKMLVSCKYAKMPNNYNLVFVYMYYHKLEMVCLSHDYINHLWFKSKSYTKTWFSILTFHLY